jgi:hypothetical protein
MMMMMMMMILTWFNFISEFKKWNKFENFCQKIGCMNSAQQYLWKHFVLVQRYCTEDMLWAFTHSKRAYVIFEWRKSQTDEHLNMYYSPNEGVADGWNMQHAYQVHRVI